MYNPKEPYNNLPLEPPVVELETKKVLKQAIAATRVLAESKSRADEIPNQSIIGQRYYLTGSKRQF
jgi:hypothetical protein